MNPLEFSEILDVIEFNGVQSPGICTLSGHQRAYKWDVKSADGSGGASTTFKGEEIADFKATFTLCADPISDVDDFIEWFVFKSVLMGFVDGKNAAEITHPELLSNGIHQVVVKSIGPIMYDNKGTGTVDVGFLEYRPPVKKGASPKPKANAANQDAKNELDTLRKEFEKT